MKYKLTTKELSSEELINMLNNLENERTITYAEVEAILTEAWADEDLTKRAEEEYREWHLIGREMWLRRETEYEFFTFSLS
jgi:hypothetical protein